MGPYADALALDQIVRSPRARALGWTPTLHSVAGNVARLLEEFRTAREARRSSTFPVPRSEFPRSGFVFRVREP